MRLGGNSQSLFQGNDYSTPNVAYDRGLSDFDVPKRFVASYVWQLPGPRAGPAKYILGGWQNSGILDLHSNFPFSVTSGIDYSYSGIGLDRADLVGNPYLPTDRPKSAHVAQWFNTAAFQSNAPGTFGTSGRNILRGPRDLICIAGSELQGGAAFGGADGEVLFEKGRAKVRSGAITPVRSITGCFLPPMPRSISASQQHAGASLKQEKGAPILPSQAELRSALGADLDRLDHLLADNPADEFARLERIELLTAHKFFTTAAADLRILAERWPDAAWVKSRLFELEEASPRGVTTTQLEEGKTFALVVGISKFRDPNIAPLEFAHEDASLLASLLVSPRVGLAPENVKVLLNSEATTGAVRAAIERDLKNRASQADTILLFIASHGTALPSGKTQNGYILTWDSDSGNPGDTAFPMADVRKLFEDEASGVRRVLIFVDVCRAGAIGQIPNNHTAVNREAQKIISDEAQLFGLLASQKDQVAFEGVQYGGGHGAFSWFLVRALNGDADFNRDRQVTMDELSRYVLDMVDQATASRQIPKQIGEIDERKMIADIRKTGIPLPDTNPSTVAGLLTASRDAPTARQLRYEPPDELYARFKQALQEQRLSAADPSGAFSFLPALKLRSAALYAQAADELRVALEDKGQQILLRYLAGDQVPQAPSDFVEGRAYFEAAELLAQDSLFLQSRRTFCEGRVAIFEKDYPRARLLLERSIRLDPDRAYAYNALGIAYLEQANYDLAILAFRDASARAPFWAYPLHNMALAFAEKGDFDEAIRTYLRAIRLAPRFAYLQYNLGLIYQRTNRLKEAEIAYRKAGDLASTSGEPDNTLGFLAATQGKYANAETFYRQALSKNPDLSAATHNLAVLLFELPGREQEALQLWRSNLARDKSFSPSRLSLAKALARLHRNPEAIQEFTEFLKQAPDYVAARLALADLYRQQNAFDLGIEQLDAVLRSRPHMGQVEEKIGDLQKLAGHIDEAHQAWENALRDAETGSDRKRLRLKLRT